MSVMGSKFDCVKGVNLLIKRNCFRENVIWLYLRHILKGSLVFMNKKSSKSDISKNILLVDDELIILDVVCEMLEMSSFSVITAQSGEQAIDIFKENKKDIGLTLLDLSMPGMGGQECLEKLLKIDPAAKIIIVSGYSASPRIKEALKKGAKGFIAKPYRLKDLIKGVEGVLKGGNTK